MMRYSIESVGRGGRAAICLEAHEDPWRPGPDQVEVSTEEAERHVDIERLARYWRRMEFEPERLGLDYARLDALLAEGTRPAAGCLPAGSQHETPRGNHHRVGPCGSSSRSDSSSGGSR